jgi:hypothetical protein
VEPVAEGVGVAAWVDVAGTLTGDVVAVGDGRTVRSGVGVGVGAGVGVADVVRSARGAGRGLAGDGDGPGVREAARCAVVRVSRTELACARLTLA